MEHRAELSVQTRARRRRWLDLTDACASFLRELRRSDGLLSVFVPHATAGIVVVELGAGSEEDLLAALDALLPRDDRWRHRHGSPGHGADHVLPLLASPSLTVPVVGGRMTLGTWQSIALLDPNADNPRRTVHLGFLAGLGRFRGPAQRDSASAGPAPSDATDRSSARRTRSRGRRTPWHRPSRGSLPAIQRPCRVRVAVRHARQDEVRARRARRRPPAG